MSRRAIHGIVLNAALVTGSVFYLLSPTIFAYVGEISMSYSQVPRWFAVTPPARITARIFDRYNANAPRAALFRDHLSCFLMDDGAKPVLDCAYELREGETVHGPQDLKLASGLYRARFAFSGSDACSSGQARLQVVTVGRFGKVLADYTGRIEAGQRIELPFRLRLMDAALAAVEFRVIGVSDCVLLTGVDWIQISP